MRTWTRFITALMLTVPLTTPASGADPEFNAKRIENLEDAVKLLKKDVERLQKDVNDSSVRGIRVSQDLQDIKEILRNMAPPREVVVRQPGYDDRSVTPAFPRVTPPTTGTIVLENVFSSAATVRINDRSFRVEPYQTRSISGVPVGSFQYSVDVDGHGPTEAMPRTDNLPTAGYRIRIFPRMPS